MSDQDSGYALKATLAVAIALTGILVIAELGVRAIDKAGLFPEFFQLLGNAKPPFDQKTGPGMYYAHQYTAYALKPGYQRGDIERINSLGFRGEEIEFEKPEDTYRIVAIGGSTTFAVYLPWNQSYPYFLQQELRERLGTDKIEVINAGMTGSTSAESFHRLATQILPLKPDMVIIYHAFNDLLPRMFNDYQEDYYHFRLSEPQNPPGMTRFYLYRLLLRAFSPAMFHENYNLTAQVWKMNNLPSTDTERTRNFLTSTNSAFKTNMDNMITLLNAKDIEPVLATFAINNNTWHWLDSLPSYIWKAGIDENNVAIRELAEEHDAPLVPFQEARFAEAARRYKVQMFADSIHMSPQGNAFKASVFADTVVPIVAEKMNLAAADAAAPQEAE